MSMTWDFIFKYCLWQVACTVIGLDREYRAKEAGYRTHFLVSLGSALIMIVSQYGFMEVVKMEGIDLDRVVWPHRLSAVSVLLERVLLFFRNKSCAGLLPLPELGYFGHRSGYWSRYVLAGNLSNNPYADWS